MVRERRRCRSLRSHHQPNHDRPPHWCTISWRSWRRSRAAGALSASAIARQARCRGRSELSVSVRHAIVLVRGQVHAGGGMGYQSRITSGVEQWAARLSAYVHNAWHGMPPPDASRWLLGKIGFWIAQPGLDAASQRHLVTLRHVRRAVAGMATSRKRLELQIGELERQAATTQSVNDQLADLRRQHADMQAKEELVTAASRRLMAEIDAFRTGREAGKATYAAAEEAAEAVWAEGNRKHLSGANGRRALSSSRHWDSCWEVSFRRGSWPSRPRTPRR